MSEDTIGYQDTQGHRWRIRLAELRPGNVYVSARRMDDDSKKFSGAGFSDRERAADWARNSIEEVFCGT